MDYILSKYCPRIEFDSYEDFYDNFKIDVPENFNFAYDVVDEWARVEPDKKALVWINDAGEEREFTFTDISLLSNRAANAFKKLGIRKGDVVMMMLRRRWGILGVRHGVVQDRRLDYPGDHPAHLERHRVPRELRSRQDAHLRR